MRRSDESFIIFREHCFCAAQMNVINEGRADDTVDRTNPPPRSVCPYVLLTLTEVRPLSICGGVISVLDCLLEPWSLLTLFWKHTCFISFIVPGTRLLLRPSFNKKPHLFPSQRLPFIHTCFSQFAARRTRDKPAGKKTYTYLKKSVFWGFFLHKTFGILLLTPPQTPKKAQMTNFTWADLVLLLKGDAMGSWRSESEPKKFNLSTERISKKNLELKQQID